MFGLVVHSITGSILLWGHFPVEGDFSLGVNMGSNSIPQKTLSDESINRGLVCAHMHFIARTQKILTFMAGNKNTPSTHHPRRRNATTLMVGLKKTVTQAKISSKMVNPRDIAGERRRDEEEDDGNCRDTHRTSEDILAVSFTLKSPSASTRIVHQHPQNIRGYFSC